MSKKTLVLFMVVFIMVSIMPNGGDVHAFAASQWVTETPLPIALTEATTQVIGDKIYVIGGNSSSATVNSVYIYNTITKQWSSGANMPTARYSESSVVINDEIYVFGGAQQMAPNYNLNTVEVYNSNTDTWRTIDAMPFERRATATTIVGNNIYVFGGVTYNGNILIAHNDVQIYNTVSKKWSVGNPMPVNRLGHYVEQYNGKIYLIAGMNDNIVNTNDVFIYDIATDTWSKGNSLNYGLSLSGSIRYGNEIYILGSYHFSKISGTTNKVSIYNISTDSWSQGVDLTFARGFNSSVIVGSKIYTIGGQNGVNYLDTVESFDLKPKHIKVVLEVGEQLDLSIDNDLSENQNVLWSSSISSVASVQHGLVTAKAIGNTRITVTYSNGSTDYIDVLVVEDADDYRLSIDLKVGGKCRLTIDDNMNTTPVTWTSIPGNIVSLNNKGKVAALNPGLALVTATDLSGNIIGQVYIRVRP